MFKIKCMQCNKQFNSDRKNRKFCSLSCSGIYNSTLKSNLPKTKKKNTYKDGHKKCPMCNIIKPLNEFHKRRNGTEPSVYCKLCTTIQTSVRQKALKRKAVEYKGGCCHFCKYDKYQGALEFHHIDPSKKDFTLAHAKLTSFEKVKNELDKCILICSNCHRELHAGLLFLKI